MLFSHFFLLPPTSIIFHTVYPFLKSITFHCSFYNPVIPFSKYNAEFFSLLIYSKSSSVIFGNNINRAKGIFRYTCSNLYNACNRLKLSINNFIIPNRTLQWQSSLLNIRAERKTSNGTQRLSKEENTTWLDKITTKVCEPRKIVCWAWFYTTMFDYNTATTQLGKTIQTSILSWPTWIYFGVPVYFPV